MVFFTLCSSSLANELVRDIFEAVSLHVLVGGGMAANWWVFDVGDDIGRCPRSRLIARLELLRVPIVRLLPFFCVLLLFLLLLATDLNCLVLRESAFDLNLAAFVLMRNWFGPCLEQVDGPAFVFCAQT